MHEYFCLSRGRLVHGACVRRKFSKGCRTPKMALTQAVQLHMQLRKVCEAHHCVDRAPGVASAVALAPGAQRLPRIGAAADHRKSLI